MARSPLSTCRALIALVAPGAIDDTTSSHDTVLDQIVTRTEGTSRLRDSSPFPSRHSPSPGPERIYAECAVHALIGTKRMGMAAVETPVHQRQRVVHRGGSGGGKIESMTALQIYASGLAEMTARQLPRMRKCATELPRLATLSRRKL